MEILVLNEQARVPVTVFQIKGELTAETDVQFLEQVEEAYQAGMRNLLLDLTKLTFLSSAGLRAIHKVFLLLREKSPGSGSSDDAVLDGIRAGTYRSRHLKLFKPSSDVMQVLSTTGFDMFLEIYTDRKKALASF